MPGGVQRYPAVGGLLAICALAAGAWDLALVAAVVGGAIRGLVIEVSPGGLTRSFAPGGAFVGPTTALPWPAVSEVHTDRRRPGDGSALETIVRGRDATIRLSTAMGLAAYWRCLADVAGRAPGASRSGLTEATLADGSPSRRHAVCAAATAGCLGLVIVALVGLHYVRRRGEGSLARHLRDTAGATATPALERCDDGPWLLPDVTPGRGPAGVACR